MDNNDMVDYRIDGHPASEYQRRILDFIRQESGDLIVVAVAGAGKTRTLVKTASLLQVPRGRSIFVAFNNHIAKELQHQLHGTGMQASTIHALGRRGLVGRIPYPTL